MARRPRTPISADCLTEDRRDADEQADDGRESNVSPTDTEHGLQRADQAASDDSVAPSPSVGARLEREYVVSQSHFVKGAKVDGKRLAPHGRMLLSAGRSDH